MALYLPQEGRAVEWPDYIPFDFGKALAEDLRHDVEGNCNYGATDYDTEMVSSSETTFH